MITQGKVSKKSYGKKGQKKVVDSLSRKEWFKLKAPPPFQPESFGQPLQIAPKMVISMLLIMTFVVGSNYFRMYHQKELRSELISLNLEFPEQKQSGLEAKNVNSIDKVENEVQTILTKFNTLVWYIQLVSVITLLSLLLNLECAKVIAFQEGRKVRIIKYSIYSGVVTQQVSLKPNDIMKIHEEGRDSFTHNDYHYTIRLISIQDPLNTKIEARSTEIIKRSNIADARRSLIYLSNVLNFDYQNKINKSEGNRLLKGRLVRTA